MYPLWVDPFGKKLIFEAKSTDLIGKYFYKIKIAPQATVDTYNTVDISISFKVID